MIAVGKNVGAQNHVVRINIRLGLPILNTQVHGRLNFITLYDENTVI